MLKINLKRCERIQYDLANSEKWFKKNNAADNGFRERLTSLGI